MTRSDRTQDKSALKDEFNRIISNGGKEEKGSNVFEMLILATEWTGVPKNPHPVDDLGYTWRQLGVIEPQGGFTDLIFYPEPRRPDKDDTITIDPSDVVDCNDMR